MWDWLREIGAKPRKHKPLRDISLPYGEREREMERAISLGIYFVDLARTSIPADVTARVPIALLAKHRAIPVKVARGCVFIALTNPKDEEALRTIAGFFDLEPKPVLALQPEIERKLVELATADLR